MRDRAIRNLYSNATTIVDGKEAFDADGEAIALDEERVEAEAARLKGMFVATEYQRKRAKDYPPVTDYLDGIVKGDQAQVDAYIAACLAVKAKYPKPQ